MKVSSNGIYTRQTIATLVKVFHILSVVHNSKCSNEKKKQ